jgi:hypothetical protein
MMTIINPRPERNISERIFPELIGEAAPVPTTDAGRFLCRRHLVDPRVADLVAQLAGLGEVETPQ